MTYIYIATIPFIVGGLAAFLKLRNPWARAGGMLLLGSGLLALFLAPVLWRVSPSDF